MNVPMTTNRSIPASELRPGMTVAWFDGINATATVERVTTDYRQRARRVHAFTFAAPVSITVERSDDDTFYLPEV